MKSVLLLILLLLRTDCWGLSPDVYTRASAVTGIPIELLLAISHVESGFQPHALNVSGRSYFPSSIYEAVGLLILDRVQVETNDPRPCGNAAQALIVGGQFG